MSIKDKAGGPPRIAPFRFGRLGDGYLLTSDVGRYCFLTSEELASVLSCEQLDAPGGRLSCREKLRKAGFILASPREEEAYTAALRKKHHYLFCGPTLHIVVVTLRCDHRCVYCQAHAGTLKHKRLDMSRQTAQAVVERILESPARSLTIEFQGGEPLAHPEAIRFIVREAKRRNAGRKKLTFVVVTNLSFMNKDIFRFLSAHDVEICSSLDGPAYIHDRNRPRIGGGSSHQVTVEWLKRIRAHYRKTGRRHGPHALLTVTRRTLKHPRALIDAYREVGLTGIHLRPMSVFTMSPAQHKALSFTCEAFFEFYREAMEYILSLNRAGELFYERTAWIFLKKIFGDTDPNFLDLRSPCGAGIGQIAYQYDGDVYTCDEGRMLGRQGDHTFRIGNVLKDRYTDLIDHETVRTLAVTSCLDNLPACHECVFRPYCGVCPVMNYAQYGAPVVAPVFDERCRRQRLILQWLFEKLKDVRDKRILRGWVMRKD